MEANAKINMTSTKYTQVCLYVHLCPACSGPHGLGIRKHLLLRTAHADEALYAVESRPISKPWRITSLSPRAHRETRLRRQGHRHPASDLGLPSPPTWTSKPSRGRGKSTDGRWCSAWSGPMPSGRLMPPCADFLPHPQQELTWPCLYHFDCSIASALLWIATDFDKLLQQNWLVSAFNLASAAFIPFWVQMADAFGRCAAIIAAVFLMLIGSALCTGAPKKAYGLLLLGRGFQGVASAGLNVVVRTILADRVTLRENAKNWAIFALVGGMSYALGPVVGGDLTKASWRWCFGINLAA